MIIHHREVLRFFNKIFHKEFMKLFKIVQKLQTLKSLHFSIPEVVFKYFCSNQDITGIT